MLHDFRLPQQTLLHGELLQPRLFDPNPIAFRLSVRARSFGQIVGIVTYVATLSLGCFCCLVISKASSTELSRAPVLTVREHANCERVPVSREICQCHVWRTLANHEVYGNEALEDDGPCRVPKPKRQRAEDLGHAGLTRVRGNEDMLDVLGFRRRELWQRRRQLL